MQAGVGVLGAIADNTFLGGMFDDATLSKNAESVVDSFSQKYTCNCCGQNFKYDQEAEIDDFISQEWGNDNTESLDTETDRSEIIESAAFEMEITDVFEMPAHGTVINGCISTGCIYAGETIDISGATGPVYHAKVKGVEMFRKLLDKGEEGDNVGLLITGVNKRDIKPGMIASHTLHINTQPKKNKADSVESEREPMVINDDDPPKGKFMKSMYNTAIKKGCKIPMLTDEEVISIGAKFGVDPIESLRTAQKNEAADRFAANAVAHNNSTRNKKESGYSENEKSYIEEYRQCLADGEISSAEIRLLKRLASSLGISESRAKELEESCKVPQLSEAEKQYLEEYRACLEDGPELSASTRRLLGRVAASLKLTDEQVKRLENM